MYLLNFLYKKNKIKIVTLLYFFITVVLFSFPVISKAAVVFSDNFSGTTIDLNKWQEFDTAGSGGSTGLIRQNNVLTTVGNNTWGGTRLVSQDQFDRADSVDLQVDFSVSATGSFAAPIVYGTNHVLTDVSAKNYLLVVHSTGKFYIAHGDNGAWSTVATTGVSVVANSRYRAKIILGEVSGVTFELYRDTTGDGDFDDLGENTNLLASVLHSIAGGVFTNGHLMTLTYTSSLTTTVYNVQVSADEVPGQINDLMSTPGNEQVGLSWTIPSNGGSAISDYSIEYKLSSEPTTWTTFSDGTSTATSTTVTGLTNGLSYDFRVSAVNSIGTGVASAVVSDTPTLSAPSQTLNLDTTIGPSGQVGLSWTSPLSNGGSAISDYSIEYKLSSEPTTWTTFSDGTSTATSTTVTGLTNGLSYDFRVSAVNSIGTGVASAVVSDTPNFYAFFDTFDGTVIDTDVWTEADSGIGGSGGSTGNVQKNNKVTIVGNNVWGGNGLETVATFDRSNGDIEITTTLQATNCTVGSSFQFGYGDMDIINGGTAYFVTKYNASWLLYHWNNGSSASVVNLTGITCSINTDITLKLVVLEGGGAEVYFNGSDTPAGVIVGGTFSNAPVWIQNYSNTVTTTFQNIYVIEPVSGPFPPSGLVPITGDEQVSLSWVAADPNGSAITDYSIEYKLSSEPTTWTTFSDGTSTATSTTVTGLTNGLSYDFRVSAVNSIGTSTATSTSSVTPVSLVASAPVAVSVNISGNTSVGELLTGTYVFIDSNGDSEGISLYRWLSSTTSNGVYSAIPGATSNIFTVTSAELGKYLKFEITPVSANSPTTGSAVLSSPSNEIDETDYFNHILSTGQSLSTGTSGSPALSTTQPYNNKTLNGTSLVPLVESGVETMSSALANTLTALSPGQTYQSAVTRHGVGSTAYSGLKKGTVPYNNGITQTTNVKNAVELLGMTDRVVGVTVIHGESDHVAGNGANYQAYLEEWQNDYETDVKVITGQSSDVPFFTDQMSSHTGYNTTTSLIPIAQLSASEDNPGDIFLVTPKYFFTYPDAAHLTNNSYRWLGEYYGKVMKKVLIDHEDWRPLSPDSVIRSGNIIDVTFHVPAGVLVFDTTLVSARTNYGFEYYDSTASATITNVEIVDSDTVRITLSNIPTGLNQKVRYAYTGVSGTRPGAQNTGSAAGNLRDTDQTNSLYGNTLYNWAVHFDKAVSLDSTAPTITSVSSDKINGTYTVGEVIDIDVVFSEAVTSSGNVTVTLETGSTDRTCTFTVSNTTTGTCNYTIQAGDTSGDLTVSSISGSIVDQAGNAMANFTPVSNLADNKSLVVDTTPPAIIQFGATPGSTSVVITWETNEDSSSVVDYDIRNTYANSTNETDTSPRVTSHSVTVTDLIACTTYYFQVRSRDTALNSASDNSFFTTTDCPGGADILSSNIGLISDATGGTTQLFDGATGIDLDIQAGTVGADAIFQIKSLQSNTFFSVAGTPEGVIKVGNYAFDLKALTGIDTSVTSFSEPIEITLTYQDSDVIGINESSLAIYRWNGVVWTLLTDCTVDTTLNTVTCTTTNFSVFSLFGTAIPSTTISVITPGSVPVSFLQNLNKVTVTICPVGHKFDSNTGLPCTNYTAKNQTSIKFTRDLKFGMSHPEVKLLQEYLNNNGYIVAKTGAGSTGKETTKFGPATKNALIKFQRANKLPSTGFFGPLTKKIINTDN